MTQNLPVSVDFSQAQATTKVLSQPKRLSSHAAGWNGLYLEYHSQPTHETPEHSPVQHVIAIQTAGTVQAERRLDGRFRQERIVAGDVCVVPAGSRHWIYSRGEQELILLCLDPGFLTRVVQENLDRDRVELIPHFTKPDPLIHQIGLSLKTILQFDPAGSRFYAELLGMALAAHLLQYYTVADRVSTSDNLSPTPVRQAIDYIHAHLTEELSLEGIAAATGISQYHFSRVFKQAIGVTPWQYVVRQRTEAAKRLLAQPELSIAAIGQRLGFANQNQFSTFFRKQTGVAPKQYRQRL